MDLGTHHGLNCCPAGIEPPVALLLSSVPELFHHHQLFRYPSLECCHLCRDAYIDHFTICLVITSTCTAVLWICFTSKPLYLVLWPAAVCFNQEYPSVNN